MKKFFSVSDAGNLSNLVDKALDIKSNPFAHKHLGENKMLGLVFLNPSLRTRMSTQIAAVNLGMDVIVMNMGQDGWALETKDGVVMNGDTVEHVKEAAAVMGSYCDVIGLRSFPSLKDKVQDYSEDFFNKFNAYCKVPLVSLESATRHPLQSLTDLITIRETWKSDKKPKILLAWAPHIKALPQAVPNSFSEWMCKAQEENLVDFQIAQPEGFELAPSFTQGASIYYDLQEGLKDVDYVYVKNWSSYENYGELYQGDASPWMIDLEHLKATNNAKVMHCLPVRRDVVLASEVLDSDHSIVIQEAGNRVWAAQAVLKLILENI